MNKALSLNTQLTKLRSVIKLLRDTLPQAVITLDSGHKDMSHRTRLQDIVYSLRDIQYELRGLTGYKAKRSKQINHYSINEIMSLLSEEINCEPKRHPEYRANIDKAKTELQTVEHYINNINISNDELF